MALEDRAAEAFENRGEDAYWQTLSTPPKKTSDKKIRPIGSGYVEPEGGGHGQIAYQEIDRLFASRG